MVKEDTDVWKCICVQQAIAIYFICIFFSINFIQNIFPKLIFRNSDHHQVLCFCYVSPDDG